MLNCIGKQRMYSDKRIYTLDSNGEVDEVKKLCRRKNCCKKLKNAKCSSNAIGHFGNVCIFRKIFFDCLKRFGYPTGLSLSFGNVLNLKKRTIPRVINSELPFWIKKKQKKRKKKEKNRKKKKTHQRQQIMTSLTTSPTRTSSSNWRNSPLGHTYKKFEAEWNAEGSNKSRAAQYSAGNEGAQARVIYFIERTRQLEVELERLNVKMNAKTKKERRHQSDVADLRTLVNDLCAKIRKVERERDTAVKEKATAQVEATQASARLKTVQLDAKKYKNADTRMHTMLVNANRNVQEQKLVAENLTDALELAKKKEEDAVADASQRVLAIETQTAESLTAANQRAEEVLEELRGIQGGWQEMKNRADASQAREDAALSNAEARIAMAENGAKAGKSILSDAGAM